MEWARSCWPVGGLDNLQVPWTWGSPLNSAALNAAIAASRLSARPLRAGHGPKPSAVVGEVNAADVLAVTQHALILSVEHLQPEQPCPSRKHAPPIASLRAARTQYHAGHCHREPAFVCAPCETVANR